MINKIKNFFWPDISSVKIGDLFETRSENPFVRYTVVVRDIKEGWVKYDLILPSGNTTHLSEARITIFLRMYKKVDKNEA